MTKVKHATAHIRHQIRTSWRRMLISILRVTYRVQDGIERKLTDPQKAEVVPKS